MNDNIKNLIEAMQNEAKRQADELETIKRDVLEIAENTVYTYECEDGRKIKKYLLFKVVCGKIVFYDEEGFEYIESSYGSRASHATKEDMLEAIGEIYNRDEINSFLFYLTQKVYPLFLRGEWARSIDSYIL